MSSCDPLTLSLLLLICCHLSLVFQRKALESTPHVCSLYFLVVTEGVGERERELYSIHTSPHVVHLWEVLNGVWL